MTLPYNLINFQFPKTSSYASFMEFNASCAFINLGQHNVKIAASFILNSFTLNLWEIFSITLPFHYKYLVAGGANGEIGEIVLSDGAQ